MAEFLWERCDEVIPCAIIASRMYLTLSNMIANYDSDAKAMYLKNKELVSVCSLWRITSSLFEAIFLQLLCLQAI